MKKSLFCLMFVFSLLTNFKPVQVHAYGECSDYGFAAMYDYLSDSCTCMSGYVFGKDLFGQTTCVSGDSVCHDKFGYNSSYDSLSDSCECDYGYVFGKDSIGRTQCVSTNSVCTDRLGFNARYNSLTDRCECRYGYVIDVGQCTDGDIVCHSKHGLYSDFNSLSNTCECDDGYTLNDSDECVKKQNNVYFTLKELDTDEKKAIVQSNYDYRYYLITYNSGCYSFSFRRYLNDNIVVNLGTDFDLDTWDRIVLQDDDEVCDITRVERADSNTTLVSGDEEEPIYYAPTPMIIEVSLPESPSTIPPAPAPKIVEIKKEIQKNFIFDESKKIDFDSKIPGELKKTGNLRKCPSATNCEIIKNFTVGTHIEVTGAYNNEEWYQVSIEDAESNMSGWMHSSVVQKGIPQVGTTSSSKQENLLPIQSVESEKTDTTTTVTLSVNPGTQKRDIWYKKFIIFFQKLFSR